MRWLAVVAILAAPALAETPAEEYKSLLDEYRQAQQEFFRPWRESGQKLDYTKHPDRTYGAKFQALAEKHPGTEAAAQALVQVLRLGPAKSAALETLLKKHIGSPALKDAVWNLRWQPGGKKALTEIAEKSPHADVRGLALLTYAQTLKDTDRAAALEAFGKIKEDYGTVPYRADVTLGAKADAEIFELTKLAIGQPAPEIEGEDIDGSPMKLSDFKGKVVVLDFWGDW